MCNNGVDRPAPLSRDDSSLNESFCPHRYFREHPFLYVLFDKRAGYNPIKHDSRVYWTASNAKISGEYLSLFSP